MFFDKYVTLCREKRETQTSVARKLGVSSANVAQWKRGSTPRYETIQKIADYFSVPVSYFFEEPDEYEKRALKAANESIEQLQELKRENNALTQAIKLLNEAQDLTPEEMEQLITYVRFIRSQRG